VNSHLVVGKVTHRRARPARYSLEHNVWYVAIDLDELDNVVGEARLIRHNRRGILAFRDSDYLPEPARDLAADIRRHLRARGLGRATARITLVTNLRQFGYQFNPASFYLARDVHGELSAVVVEVHNTYGERHLYTLAAERRAAGEPFAAEMDKAFFVSPFIGATATYRVTVRDSADRLVIAINERQDGEQLLATGLVLRKMPMTNRNLVRLLARYPLVTHKTLALIHWHALRLWIKRVPLLSHVPRAAAEPAAAGSFHGVRP